jgi:hypothetical protein
VMNSYHTYYVHRIGQENLNIAFHISPAEPISIRLG